MFQIHVQNIKEHREQLPKENYKEFLCKKFLKITNRFFQYFEPKIIQGN